MYRGMGVSKLKNHPGIISSPKMIILQGVRHLIPHLGRCQVTDPQKGGYTVSAPALDLTTLFEVIFHTQIVVFCYYSTKFWV